MYRWIIFLIVWTSVSGTVVFAADPHDPQIKDAVKRATGWLHDAVLGENLAGGYDSLAGYALLKGGRGPSDEAVQRVRRQVELRFATGRYQPRSHHVYEAGCDLMFLEALDPEQYESQLNAIVAYLVASQRASGGWNYPTNDGYGDQSITQYAALGLWAARRADSRVPTKSWDALAAWEVDAQLRSDGGFTYHPSGTGVGGKSSPTMTVAGVANLLLARRHLYGEAARKREKAEQEKAEPPKFGILQKIEAEELAEGPPEEGKGPEKPDDYRARTPEATIDRAVASGSNWLALRFPTLAREIDARPYYFWYGLERMAALQDVETIGEIDWYDAGADWLLRRQERRSGRIGGNVTDTAFAILFLQQTTRELLGRKRKRGLPVGSGLLAGGRGMPEDLSKVVAVRDGEAEVRQSSDPLDELLAALGDPSSGDTVAAQKALVEKIRLGDREELVAREETVLELVRHPSWEVRRTAIWALGRIERLEHATLLVAALEDPEVDVAVEARNALCYLARKPLGLGATQGPFEDLPESATAEKKAEVAAAWQKDVHARWSKWLAEKTPYDERDRLPRGLRIRSGRR